jgi:plasmid segregation protein ParM
MKEKLLLACDVGRHTSKAIMNFKGKTYITMFRTKIMEIERLGLEIQPASFYVKLFGKEYLVGDMVSEDYSLFDLDKTSLHQQIATFTCVADLLQKAHINPQQFDIRLACNIPINMYKNADHKLKYKQFIENQGNQIVISVNQKTSVFILTDVTVAFEGVGILYEQNPTALTVTNVIDIGGLNATLCTFTGIQPNFDSMNVSKLGINMLKGKIGKALNEQFGIAISANDLEQILQTGHLTHKGKVNEESKNLITKIKKEHFFQIIQFAQSRGYTFIGQVQFCGGGSLALQDFIREEFPGAIVINPQFANVRSFQKILEVKYSDKSNKIHN